MKKGLKLYKVGEYLKVGRDQAPSYRDGGGGEGPGDADVRQQLRDVGRQAERHRTVPI